MGYTNRKERGLKKMLLGISAVAGGLILVAMAMRPFLKTAPHWLRAGIWLLPFGRLLIPYSAFSVELPGGLRIFWLCGVGACLLYGAVTTLYLYLKTAGAVEYEDRIFVHDSIPFPFALGRRCYMPFEEDHIRRTWLVYQLRRGSSAAALAVRCVVFLALAIHWFNPLAWLAVIFSRRDWDSVHDDMALQEKGILPCGAEEVPMWLRFCPLAAFQRGGADRRRGCELRMTGENQKRGVSAVLAGAVALATALTLIPPIPEGEATREKPLNLTGTYSMEGYGYRNPLAVGLMERDGISYEFSEELLVLRDVTSGDSVNVIPLKNVRWTALPFTKAQWGRLLWWVDPEELPYLDADYADLGNGLCLLRTELGLYLLRGKTEDGELSLINGICALQMGQSPSPIHTDLPQGRFAATECVAWPSNEEKPADDSGYLYEFYDMTSVRLLERRTGMRQDFLVAQTEWKRLTQILAPEDYLWMAKILGGEDVLDSAGFYARSSGSYLIRTADKLYMGHGMILEKLTPLTCGKLFLLEEAPESILPKTGVNMALKPRTWSVGTKIFVGAPTDRELPQFVEVKETEIRVWYNADQVRYVHTATQDGQWIYFPEVTGSVGKSYPMCLSDAYVRILSDTEFLLCQGGRLSYGIGFWNQETQWLQITTLYTMSGIGSNPLDRK